MQTYDQPIVKLLLVDDDEIDVESVRRAFEKQRIANPIISARDGVEALEILRGSGETSPLERPYIILLDLNMPRMNGIEFLRELRSDERLHDSIVIVLTTSNADKDLVQAYEQHIAGYLVKSRIGPDFVDLINLLQMYWRVVELPPDRR